MFYIRVITCGINDRFNMIRCSGLQQTCFKLYSSLGGIFVQSFLLAYVGDCRVKKVKEFMISLG